jgi:hypothetical protein
MKKNLKRFSEEHRAEIVYQIVMCGNTDESARILANYEKLVRADESRKRQE